MKNIMNFVQNYNNAFNLQFEKIISRKSFTMTFILRKSFIVTPSVFIVVMFYKSKFAIVISSKFSETFESLKHSIIIESLKLSTAFDRKKRR